MSMYHLYTIVALIMGLMLLWRLLNGPRCGHDWEPIVERELPSVVEMLPNGEIQNWRSAPLVFKAGRKKFFAVIGCKKCGETKMFETMSGEDP